MPNRILRDYTDSDKVDKISPQAETCFIRLIMKVDDFGKFHGHPTLLKSALFPLKVDRITEKQMDGWMDELDKVGLIVRYEVNSKRYLKINDFGQRLRLMHSKFPDPLSNDRTMTAECQHDDRLKRSRNETEVETEVETESVSVVYEIYPSFNDFWDAYQKKVDRGKSEKAWNKLTQMEKEAVMLAIPHYIAFQPDKKFRKDPASYLYNRSWENEMPQQKSNHQKLFKDESELADFLAVRPDGK